MLPDFGAHGVHDHLDPQKSSPAKAALLRLVRWYHAEIQARPKLAASLAASKEAYDDEPPLHRPGPDGEPLPAPAERLMPVGLWAEMAPRKDVKLGRIFARFSRPEREAAVVSLYAAIIESMLRRNIAEFDAHGALPYAPLRPKVENGLWAILLGNYHVFGAGLRCHAEAMHLYDFMTGRVILNCLECMELGPEDVFFDDLTRVASVLRVNARPVETEWMRAHKGKRGLDDVALRPLSRLVEAIKAQYELMPILAMMHGATTMIGLAYGGPAGEFWPQLVQVRARTLLAWPPCEAATECRRPLHSPRGETRTPRWRRSCRTR